MKWIFSLLTLLLTISITAPVRAAITIVNNTTTSVASTSSSMAITVSTSAAALILVMYTNGAQDGNSQGYPPTGISGSTLGAFTIDQNVNVNNAYNVTYAIAHKVASGALSSEIITITLAGTPAATQNRLLTVLEITGYDTVTPIGATATDDYIVGTGRAYAVTSITPQKVGSFIFVTAGDWYSDGYATATPNADSTLIQEYNTATNAVCTHFRSTTGVASTNPIAIGSSTTMASQGWGAGAVEVRSAASGGVTCTGWWCWGAK
jgi:hypothetical protein